MKWKKLYDYLDGKDGCNFRKEKGKITWDCDAKTLTKTRQFCKQNNINFNKVKKTCYETGGFCDCEVLFNTMENITPNTELPKSYSTK